MQSTLKKIMQVHDKLQINHIIPTGKNSCLCKNVASKVISNKMSTAPYSKRNE